ncbi:trypsin-like peptidase domain-containing protein [Sphingobacterium phlebotomi]|uniref:Trypsin-like peptidase domain-containing protein n=1 Tax=Sphingobacterium phlebotomi TaxID=2605433 RepID=A0A5D4H4Z9_9SPHI|nr:trypsin-like peptidase domain-containing protein [Sphingobacterium phlebotomi]TYR33880.1 trypsin-like peptidase domain-containing protein [Sphingobacterium phlebotomi]
MKGLNQQEFTAWADAYLRGELSHEDQLKFEMYCAENPANAELFAQHKAFLTTMKRAESRSNFKRNLEHIAQDYHKVHTPKPATKVISLWDRLKLNAAVAAAIAIVSVFSTLWLTGYYKNLRKATSDYSALRRDMNTVKRNVNAQNAAIQNINNTKDNTKDNVKETMHYGATGFMITKNGYVVTNYHVITGADSVHLQNHKGESFKADIVFTNPEKDLAILHINDSTFKSIKSIPYTFKRQDSDMGEDVYTIGFPRDEAVYGQGYLSSSTGYAGDTLAYQISIPVNPGNSGGPLLDKEGNVIGIISGKQKGIDGAAFAIKTKALMETLNSIPADSLNGKNVVLNNKNLLQNLSRTDQIKKLQDYVYIVKVY